LDVTLTLVLKPLGGDAKGTVPNLEGPCRPRKVNIMTYFSRVLILPVGSFEYHGTELPANTDTAIARAVADSLATRLETDFNGQIKVLPALEYGLSAEHTGLPNTAFVPHMAYYDFVMGLVSSISTPKDLLVIVNGHGGNVHTLGAVESDFNYNNSDRKLFVPALYPSPIKRLSDELFGEFDAHAGSVEASLMAHYEQRPAREYTIVLPKRVRGSLRFFKMADLTSHGVIKQQPIVIADPVKGLTLHDAMVEELAVSVSNLIAELAPVLSGLEAK
jgi:creatinine amidohydrolase